MSRKTTDTLTQKDIDRRAREVQEVARNSDGPEPASDDIQQSLNIIRDALASQQLNPRVLSHKKIRVAYFGACMMLGGVAALMAVRRDVGVTCVLEMLEILEAQLRQLEAFNNAIKVGKFETESDAENLGSAVTKAMAVGRDHEFLRTFC